MLVLKIAGGIVLAFVVLLVGLAALASVGTDTSTIGYPEDDEPAGGEALTWTWVSFPRCTYQTGQCFAIEVTAQADCPRGVYAEVNLVDKGGTVIGYTNDTLGRLDEGRSAVLTFDTFDRAARSAEVTEVTCHG